MEKHQNRHSCSFIAIVVTKRNSLLSCFHRSSSYGAMAINVWNSILWQNRTIPCRYCFCGNDKNNKPTIHPYEGIRFVASQIQEGPLALAEVSWRVHIHRLNFWRRGSEEPQKSAKSWLELGCVPWPTSSSVFVVATLRLGNESRRLVQFLSMKKKTTTKKLLVSQEILIKHTIFWLC